MPLKHLQHMQHVQHPLVYFCNIHMKRLQHASETSKIIEAYIYNIGGESLGRSILVDGVGTSGEWLRASTTTSANGTGLGSAVTVRDGERGAPWPPG